MGSGGPLGQGPVELRIDEGRLERLLLAADRDAETWASFLVHGRLAALQLGAQGVTRALRDVVRVTRLAVSLDAALQLATWAREDSALRGRLSFDRSALDRWRGRGPLTCLTLDDATGRRVAMSRPGRP